MNDVNVVPQKIIDMTINILSTLENYEEIEQVGITASTLLTVLKNLPVNENKLKVIDGLMDELNNMGNETYTDLNASKHMELH